MDGSTGKGKRAAGAWLCQVERRAGEARQLCADAPRSVLFAALPRDKFDGPGASVTRGVLHAWADQVGVLAGELGAEDGAPLMDREFKDVLNALVVEVRDRVEQPQVVLGDL